MNCDECELLVSKSLDGEASPAEQARLEAHCTECATCRDHRTKQAELHARLGAGLGGFLDALRPEPKRRGWSRLARVAAVLALMLASGLVGYAARGPGEPAAGPKEWQAVPVADTPEPIVTVAKAENKGAEQLIWDEENGLRRATRIDINRIYRVVDPGGAVEITWHTRDNRYQFAGLSDWR